MDQRLISNVSKLTPYPAAKKSFTGLTYVYYFEPPPEDKRGLGSFMVVIEVMAKRQLAGELADIIIKTLGDTYYNEESGEIIDERFENALNKVNKNIAELAEKKDYDLSGKISAIMAVLADDILHLTQCGNAGAFLYRAGDVINITDGLNEENPLNQKKIFQNVAGGRLEENDKILLGSPAVFFHYQESELTQMVQDNSPSTLTSKISSMVSGDENAARFGAIMVELLTPESATQTEITANNDVMVGTPPNLANEARQIAEPATKKAAKKTAEIAGQVKDWSQDKLIPSVKHRTKTGWNHLWTRYINPNPKLALSIAGLVLILMIGFSIYLTNNTSGNRTKLLTFKEAIALTDSAEAKLALNQKSEAADLIKSAEQKLIIIRQKPGEENAINKAITRDADLKGKNLSVANLQSRIDLIEDKIAGIAHITPEVLYELKKSNNPKFTNVVFLGDQIYAINSTAGEIYQIDPNNKSAQTVGSHDDLKKVKSVTAGYSGDVIYFLTSKPSVIAYKPRGGVSTLKLSAGEWTSGEDIASYIGNLYILSRSSQQIWRHTPTAIGFSARSGWMDDQSEEIAKSTVLAVNGNIFALSENNTLSMYANGIKKDFNVADIPKSIGKPIEMLINSEGNQLIVLTDKNIVYRLNLTDQGAVFDKQFTIDKMPKITSIGFDQKNSNIFLTADNKVVKFTP